MLIAYAYAAVMACALPNSRRRWLPVLAELPMAVASNNEGLVACFLLLAAKNRGLYKRKDFLPSLFLFFNGVVHV